MVKDHLALTRVSIRQGENLGDQLDDGYYKRSQRDDRTMCFASGKLISASSFLPVITIPAFLFIPLLGATSVFTFVILLSVPLFLSPEHNITIHLFKWLHAMPVMSVSCSFFHLRAQPKVEYSVDSQHIFINAPIRWVHLFCDDFALPEVISESKASLMQSLRTWALEQLPGFTACLHHLEVWPWELRSLSNSARLTELLQEVDVSLQVQCLALCLAQGSHGVVSLCDGHKETKAYFSFISRKGRQH